MEYQIKIFPLLEDKDVQWVAEYPDFPNVVGGGYSPEEALKSAEENLAYMIDYYKELGLPLPQPVEAAEEYSGKFTARISKTLHKKLSQLAQAEQVSINQIVTEAITQRINAPFEVVCEKLNVQMDKFSKIIQDYTGYIQYSSEYLVNLRRAAGDVVQYNYNYQSANNYRRRQYAKQN